MHECGARVFHVTLVPIESDQYASHFNVIFVLDPLDRDVLRMQDDVRVDPYTMNREESKSVTVVESRTIVIVQPPLRIDC